MVITTRSLKLVALFGQRERERGEKLEQFLIFKQGKKLRRHRKNKKRTKKNKLEKWKEMVMW